MGERSYRSIGQVLDLLKVEFPDLTISKIRFLESQGLLDPERTPSGYRKFYDTEVDRLRFILREQQEHYLPLKVIKGRLAVDSEAESGHSPAVDEAGDEPRRAVAAVARAADPEPSGTLGYRGRDPVAFADPGVPRLELVDTGEPMDDPVSLTLDELAAAVGLTTADIAELERFGLLTGHRLVGTTYYDADCLEIAALAATFRTFGVEARHLRMYRTAVEREAGFFEQVVTPMLKQRNPQAKRQAVETLLELSRIGQAMRAAVLRQALRGYIGGP